MFKKIYNTVQTYEDVIAKGENLMILYLKLYSIFSSA